MSKMVSHILDHAPELVPLSDLSILIFPKIAMNFLRAWIKGSVSIVNSRWAALLAKQVKMMLYFFNSVLQNLIVKGPNISKSQHVNGGVSCILSSGKSTILWVSSLPLSLLHITHSKIMLLQKEFSFITQKSEFLKQFKVNPVTS